MVGQLLPLLQDRRYVGETAPHLHDSLTLTPSCLKDILAVEGRRPYERSSELGIPAANCTFADIGPFEGVSLAVAESSASAAAFDRARQWLSHCLDNHPRCRDADLSEHHLAGPRRLLKLAAGDSGDLQLVDFDGSTARPEYACLSYRWGDDLEGVLTTTRQNVDGHLAGICEGRLPGAIKDAIRVCRELGIQYLWVDSLCILQQDDVDFAMEGAKMDTIYANSHLTIYAKHTNSCKAGFLGPQLRGQPAWQYLAPFPSARTGLPFFVRRGELNRTPFPLDSRGWCLQESMLPRRQLLYTGEEMVWRCNTHGLCECGHIVGHKFEDGGFDSRYASHFLKTAWKTPGQYAETWRKTVEEYSRRSLTNPQDKLAAIAGLARLGLPSSSTRNNRYFAGLWKEGLPTQLLWRLHYNDDWVPYVSRRHDEATIYGHRLLNGTPTWSWASVQGAVDFRHTLDKTSAQATAQIDSISCIPSHTENPLGPVTSGLVVLTAPVLPVRLAFLALNKPTKSRHPDVTLVSHTNGNCPLWTLLVSLDIEQTVHGGVEYCRRIPQDVFPPTHDGCSCKLHLSSKPYLACGIRLYIHERSLTGSLNAMRWNMDFLLLEGTPYEGTYRRVGLITGEMLPVLDGEEPAGAGVHAQRLFWVTLPPDVPREGYGHKPGIRPFLKDQDRVKPWPSKIGFEWKQVRII